METGKIRAFQRVHLVNRIESDVKGNSMRQAGVAQAGVAQTGVAQTGSAQAGSP